MRSGVKQGGVLAPLLFNAGMDWVMSRTVAASDCGARIGNAWVTDLDFADDAALLAELMDVLVLALDSLNEEAKPLGLKVSWIKTKIQAFGISLDETERQVAVCGEC